MLGKSDKLLMCRTKNKSLDLFLFSKVWDTVTPTRRPCAVYYIGFCTVPFLFLIEGARTGETSGVRATCRKWQNTSNPCANSPTLSAGQVSLLYLKYCCHSSDEWRCTACASKCVHVFLCVCDHLCPAKGKTSFCASLGLGTQWLLLLQLLVCLLSWLLCFWKPDPTASSPLHSQCQPSMSAEPECPRWNTEQMLLSQLAPISKWEVSPTPFPYKNSKHQTPPSLLASLPFSSIEVDLCRPVLIFES